MIFSDYPMLRQHAIPICAFVRFVCVSKKIYATSNQGETEIWYVECSHKYKINYGVMIGGR